MTPKQRQKPHARHSRASRTAEAGSRSENSRSEWPEGRAAGAARNPVTSLSEENWSQRALGDVVRTMKGRKPAHVVSAPQAGALPYATADYFRNGLASSFIPKAELSRIVQCHEGSPVLIWDGSNAGEVFLGKDAVLASTMARIEPDPDVLDPLYCYFFLKTAFEVLNERTTGSTIPHVSRATLESLLIPTPPKPEQQKIAAILWKMQRAIATQDRLIVATRDLKQSAMQKLFTHGLRGEALKDTEIGPMPESWKVVALGDFGRIGNGSTPKKTTPEYWRNPTTPWLTSAKVHDGIINSADQFVSDIAVKECHLPIVPAGSLLVAITGQGKTLGNAALVEFDTTINQHLAYVRFDHDDAVPGYVYQFMRSRYEELQGIGRAGGSTKAALTCAFLRDYRLPLPAPDEQRDIATALATLDRKLAHHQQKRAALNDLFQTTLHQLMTAQVRVADLDIDTSDVVTPSRQGEAA